MVGREVVTYAPPYSKFVGMNCAVKPHGQSERPLTQTTENTVNCFWQLAATQLA